MRIMIVAAMFCCMSAAFAQTDDARKPESSGVSKPEISPAQGGAGQSGQKKPQGETASGSNPDEHNKKANKEPPPQYYGHFDTTVLAGGTINVLVLPFAHSLLRSQPTARLELLDTLPPPCDKQPTNVTVAYTKSNPENSGGETWVGIELPALTCWYTLSRRAKLTIEANVGAAEPGTRTALFDENISISGFWLPLLITLVVVALIYPGCAAIYWFMRQRNKASSPSPAATVPSFWETLDPVQITANQWGRASIGKLQIFLFTIIVFALFLFYLFRSGVLASMSNDVMVLLGISAAGAVGGKVAHRANRRISFTNWTWLVRHEWLPKTGNRDVAPRARWSELFLDSNTKEFDPYSFQMAVFSVVVAIALARTSFTGLGTFKIPVQLLELLGLSQIVFVGGKALDDTGFPELDDKLDEVRGNEQELAALLKKQDRKAEDVTTKTNQLLENTAQAAQMFMEIYRNQIPNPPGIPDVVTQAANKKISVGT